MSEDANNLYFQRHCFASKRIGCIWASGAGVSSLGLLSRVRFIMSLSELPISDLPFEACACAYACMYCVVIVGEIKPMYSINQINRVYYGCR